MARESSTIFQALKPRCVALNDTIVSFQKGKSSPKDVVDKIQGLLDVLLAKGQYHGLDARLADYVFFPLSGVFRDRQKLPVIALERALLCSQILLKTGWSSITDPNVASQLLILLTYLADAGDQGPHAPTTSGPLRQAAFECLTLLFEAVERSASSKQSLLDTANIPAVGHAVSVMLDGIRLRQDAGTRMPAVEALRCFVFGVATPDVLQSFLPGIVSAVVHAATASPSARPSYKVLKVLLEVLRALITVVLSDVRVSTKTDRSNSKSNSSQDFNKWIEATSARMKQALAQLSRLRGHDRPEVRTEVRELYCSVLTECQDSLSDSCSTAFDTVVMLAQRDDDMKSLEALEHLVASDLAVTEVARSVLYDWLISLPRVLSANDTAMKAQTIQKITIIYRVLSETDADMTVIDDLMAANLIDGLKSYRPLTVDNLGVQTDAGVAISQDTLLARRKPMSPIQHITLTDSGIESNVLLKVKQLAEKLASSKNGLRLAQTFMHYARQSQGANQSVHFWLCISILHSRQQEYGQVSDYLEVSDDAYSQSALEEEAYSYALSILSSPEGGEDNHARMQMLSLEAIGLQARRMGTSFRAELVDALYPVVHLMGSAQAQVCSNALDVLDSIASATGYSTTQDLLIQNVDYLVNAISLKLNTFDISPQAPQVLLMMTKLCGPKLLPYLEDLVDSTFDALEHFHGYPKLVELLFSMLSGIVEEGSQAQALSIGGSEQVSHLKPSRKPRTMADTIESFRQRRHKADEKARSPGNPASDNLPIHTPHRPWKELHSFDEELAAVQKRNDPKESNDAEDATSPPDTDPSADIVEAVPTKTYQTVQRICALTQHHLPSASPSIRSLLLSLLNRATPYLAAHEDSFLPLIHTLWPILVSRISDPEAFVVAGVLDVMAGLCEAAGDFMSNRIESLWPSVQRIWRQLEGAMRPTARVRDARQRVPQSQENIGRRELRATVPGGLVLHPDAASASISAAAPTDLTLAPSQPKAASTSTFSSLSSNGDHYVPTTILTIFNALTHFLIAVLNHVRIPEAMFTEILSRMLYRPLVEGRREDVKEALGRLNPDAVWLVLERARWERGEHGKAGKDALESARPEGFAIVC